MFFYAVPYLVELHGKSTRTRHSRKVPNKCYSNSGVQNQVGGKTVNHDAS